VRSLIKQVGIGIYCHEQPERLSATIESVRRHTRVPVELFLLPDGPDARTKQALQRWPDLPQSATESASGVAACFNRLAGISFANILVLLESGCVVTPGWLEYLMAALAADPGNGLAGPSTNRSWNEQSVFARAGDTPSQIAATALEARQKFGETTRRLEPLHSLADFCYVVRREVIASVGAADERYGPGPCWEMDYNIRAARAGWHGVWACASYVHRAPPTMRRRSDEARYFEASKRLYQGKFCGARLRAETQDYRPHCRGDACANFAPVKLIEIKRDLTIQDSTRKPTLSEALSLSPPALLKPTTQLAETQREPFADRPLVSCIMPTHNRRRFVPQAIRCFLRQDYPNLELLIVDDGSDQISDCLPESSRIRYLRLDRKLTIGAKRNVACEQAHG